jgi:succinate dehydrogenase/fumarate reductase flavoprotein subunit
MSTTGERESMAAFDYDLGILGGGAAGLTAAAGAAQFGAKTVLRFLFDLKGRACTPEGEAG